MSDARSDTDAGKPVVRAPVPAGDVLDVESVLQRLRVAEQPALTHNAWRSVYAQDVRFLLDQLRGDRE